MDLKPQIPDSATGLRNPALSRVVQAGPQCVSISSGSSLKRGTFNMPRERVLLFRVADPEKAVLASRTILTVLPGKVSGSPTDLLDSESLSGWGLDMAYVFTHRDHAP
jgi:hypothetical protein